MKCNDCKSDLENGANKCIRCGSFQNWKRHLTFSSTVLSLLVALTSVTGIVAPLIYEKFHHKTSNVKASISNVGYLKPRGGSSMNGLWTGFQFHLNTALVITNSGEKTGLITGGMVELLQSGKIIGKGKFVFTGEKSQIKTGEVRAEEIEIPITFEAATQLPAKIMDGPNGSVLDATEEGKPLPMKALNEINAKATIKVVQSNGKIDILKLELEPGDIDFTIL